MKEDTIILNDSIFFGFCSFHNLVIELNQKPIFANRGNSQKLVAKRLDFCMTILYYRDVPRTRYAKEETRQEGVQDNGTIILEW